MPLIFIYYVAYDDIKFNFVIIIKFTKFNYNLSINIFKVQQNNEISLNDFLSLKSYLK